MKTYQQALAMAVLFGTSVPGFCAPGEIVANAYHNKFVGLRFPVPPGWYVGTDAEVEQGIKGGARIVGLDGARAQAMIKQMPGKVLLMLSEKPLDSDVPNLNRNMIVLAIDVRSHKEEIGSGADYLKVVGKELRTQFPDADISEISMRRFGGKDFYKVDVRLAVGGVTAHQSQVAHINNDYLVVINLTAATRSELEQLCSLVGNLAFSEVPPEVDGSPDGQSFRRQAGFAPSRSSGNPLKTIGLILMGGGALLMLRNLGNGRPNQ